MDTLTPASEFGLLLDSFEQEPVACEQALRGYAQVKPEAFLVDARHAILTRPPSDTLRCIVELLPPRHVLQTLVELYIRSRAEAIEFSKKIMACDPNFDLALIALVEDKQLARESEQIVLCALDLLDEISDRDRLVLNILMFLKHPSPTLRSKAARMIGHRRPNASWMNKVMAEPDARVRANAVESLFSVHTEFSHELFRTAANDPNNRVAGNARLGLYLQGDTSAIPLILDLARDPRPVFRSTAAWVMSQTGDGRFAGKASELMADSEEIVRRQAFKALGHIRKALKANAAKKALQVSIVKHGQTSGEHQLSLAVQDASGQPVKNIPGINFAVKLDGRFVQEYKVHEYDCTDGVAHCYNVAWNSDAGQLEILVNTLEAYGSVVCGGSQQA